MSRELLKQALDCMQCGPWTQDTKEKYNQTITAIRAHIDNTKDVEQGIPYKATSVFDHKTVEVSGYISGGVKELGDFRPLQYHPAPRSTESTTIPPGMVLVAEKDNEAVRGILATPGNYRTYQDQWSALLAAAKGE